MPWPSTSDGITGSGECSASSHRSMTNSEFRIRLPRPTSTESISRGILADRPRRASFAPTLGSTVVKSAGADWIGSKDDSGDDEYDEALNYSSTTTAANGPSVHGTPIAVLVEREVV